MSVSRGIRPNAGLVGDPHGRSRLDTPALILDLDVLERNVLRMAAWGRETGLGIRPHLKSHKSVRIAQMQREAGASGFCCATIGEAEVMVRAGLGDILITSPLVTEEKIARAVALLDRDPGLCLVVDDAGTANLISAVASGVGRTIQVLVDIDPGLQRTGVPDRAAAIDLVRRVGDLPGVRYAGIQCYAGQVQHVHGFDARSRAGLSVLSGLRDLCAELTVAGLAPGLVSGGGTGTHDIDPQAGVLTELQVGSYVLMDNQYNDVWLADRTPPPFEVALFVQATVISANHAGHVTCDAGLKHFAVDGGRPVVANHDAAAGAAYAYFGDVHGRLSAPAGGVPPARGTRIEFVVPHCDPTVNLYDEYHCVRGGELVDIWPVDARGV